MDEKFRQNVGGTNVSILKNEVCPTNKIWILIIESKIRPRICYTKTSRYQRFVVYGQITAENDIIDFVVN